MRLAILLASYNRHAVTRRAISSVLREAAAMTDLEARVFLLDDASPDRTGERIAAEFPRVTVSKGTGALYWNGAMRRLVAQVRENDAFDCYLLLNDDVDLIPGRLADAVHAFCDRLASGEPSILIGPMADPSTGACTYSGMRRLDHSHPLRLALVPPAGTVIACDTGNANFMLVPAIVLDRLGNLDPRFRHGGGDLDLPYRAAACGFGTVIAPDYVGYCRRNPPLETDLARFPLRQRIRFVLGPKYDLRGLIHFLRVHGDTRWPIHAATAIARALAGAFAPRLLAYRRRPLTLEEATP